MPGIGSLAYQPQIITDIVGDEIVEYFERIHTIPALSFIDPWGYKGLSLRLIKAVVKDFGCEAIFFFNFNRINMGIRNPIVEPHMTALFGEDRLEKLKRELPSMTPPQRERRIRVDLGKSLEEMGAPFLIPFRFLRDSGRVSHYICFVSKHPLAYMIMKEIMAGKGVVDDDGVPKFEYFPETAGTQLSLDEERPILSLPSLLLKAFADQTISVDKVYEVHNVGTPFIRRNYKTVLIEMEEGGVIGCYPPKESRPKRGGMVTMGDQVRITFPE